MKRNVCTRPLLPRGDVILTVRPVISLSPATTRAQGHFAGRLTASGRNSVRAAPAMCLSACLLFAPDRTRADVQVSLPVLWVRPDQERMVMVGVVFSELSPGRR